MGGLISEVFAGMYMFKMEVVVIVLTKPLFYKRHVDDTCACLKKNIRHMFFEDHS